MEVMTAIKTFLNACLNFWPELSPDKEKVTKLNFVIEL